MTTERDRAIVQATDEIYSDVLTREGAVRANEERGWGLSDEELDRAYREAETWRARDEQTIRAHAQRNAPRRPDSGRGRRLS